MAKITKDSYFLFIDPLGGTAYKNVVCLTTFNFAGTTTMNDASTMCGPDTSPGDRSATIAFNGQTMLSPMTGDISAPNIFPLWDDETLVGWKIGKATPTTGDMTKTGQGYLSAYGETYDKGQKGAFSGTITVAGDVDQTVTS